MQFKDNVIVLFYAVLTFTAAADDQSCSSATGECGSVSAPVLFQSAFVKKDNLGAPEGLMVIPLQKLPERSFEGHAASAGRTFHVGNITVGYPPQTLQVMFDTGSPYVLLAHRGCRSKACREHHRYSTWNSQTAVDIDLTGERLSKSQRIVKGPVNRDAAYFEFESSDLGAGKAKGVLARDTICLKDAKMNRQCAKQGIVIALEMDDMPFRALPCDGIVGLGLKVGCGKGEGICSFFDTLLQSKPEMLPQFGLTFGKDGGELHVGGYHPSALASPLHWFPAHSPEEGLWQVEIHSVRVGNRVINSCDHGCHAVIDTSANRLGVGESELPKMSGALAAASFFDGQCHGGDLVFDLGGMTIVLGPEDYMDPACKPDLGPIRLDTSISIDKGDVPSDVMTFGSHVSTMYAFGQLVLRHYFVAFDWKAKTVGFAPSAGASAEMGKAAAGAVIEQVTV